MGSFLDMFCCARIHAMLALLLAGCAAGAPTSMATPNAQPDAEITPAKTDRSSFYYYADGKRVDLIPSLEWISVKFSSQDPGEQLKALQPVARFLRSFEQRREIQNAQIALLPLKTGMTISELVEGINFMRSRPASFLQVNPVFQVAGGLLVLTDEFIAGFQPGQSKEVLQDINSTNNVEIVEPVLGQGNTFVLRVLPGARLDTLAMANYYQEGGIALFSEPNFLQLHSP